MPSNLRSPPAPEAPKESVVSRLLIAPLTFVSFLLSLALVDTRNTSARGTGQPRGVLARLLYRPAAPYAYITAKEGAGGKGEREGETEQWHWHTKQRQQMRAEVADAFAVRVWVVYALAGAALAGLVGAWVVGAWALGMVRGRW